MLIFPSLLCMCPRLSPGPLLHSQAPPTPTPPPAAKPLHGATPGHTGLISEFLQASVVESLVQILFQKSWAWYHVWSRAKAGREVKP